MKNFKHFVSLNLLSLMGFIFMTSTLIFVFLFSTQTVNFDSRYGLFNLAYRYFIFVLFIEIILFLSVLIEFIYNKFKKFTNSTKIIKIPKKLERIHATMLYIGLLLAFLPFVFLAITFL